jgi:hypothetical protein
MRTFYIIALFFSSSTLLLSQETSEDTQKKHLISAIIGHTHVSDGIANGRKKSLILPSWAFNYDYHINGKWSIGLHTDMIIEEFEVEVEDENNVIITLDRSRPVAIALATSYRLNNFLILSAGAGREFAPEGDFTIFRLSIDPYFPLPNDWELIGTFSFDFRVDAYNAYNFGLGIAKRL